jgi:hypothetical protein
MVDSMLCHAEEIGHLPARQEGRQNFLVSVLKILVVRGKFCSRKLSDILSHRPDILHSTRTISEHNLKDDVIECIDETGFPRACESRELDLSSS